MPLALYSRVSALLVLTCLSLCSFSQGSYQIAVLKYNGGGDYYANPTSVPNLVKFCNRELKMNILPDVPFVEAGSPDIFNYPLIHMTGHGNVVFNMQEIENLRKYLTNGGFLHIDDNYGMDKFIRNEMKKIFPELELTELPVSHPIYHQKYDFNGMPKIHEHDEKPAKGLGYTYEGRLVLLYTFETDLGDGWEDIEVHNDSDQKRTEALRMGANIVIYAMTGGIR